MAAVADGWTFSGSSSVAPVIPVGVELDVGADVGGAFSSVDVAGLGVGLDVDFRVPAFAAASAPACRIAIAKGVSSFLREEAGFDVGASLLGSDIEMWRSELVRAGASGLGISDVVGVVLAVGVVPDRMASKSCTPLIWSFNSPYSFHSSIWSRSYMDVNTGACRKFETMNVHQ